MYPRKNKEGKVIGSGDLLGAHHEWPQEALRIGEVQDRNPAALNRAKADRDGGLVYGADSLKVEEYLRRWLEDSVRGMMRGTTFERYEQICRKHVVPTLGRVKVKDLTPAHVRGFYKEKLRNLSLRSVRYVHVTLHRALNQAVLDGLLPRNVTEAVKPSQIDR